MEPPDTLMGGSTVGVHLHLLVDDRDHAPLPISRHICGLFGHQARLRLPSPLSNRLLRPRFHGYLGLARGLHPILPTDPPTRTSAAPQDGLALCWSNTVFGRTFRLDSRHLRQRRTEFSASLLLAGFGLDVLHLPRRCQYLAEANGSPPRLDDAEFCLGFVSHHPESLEVHLGLGLSSSTYGCLSSGGLVGLGAELAHRGGNFVL